MLLVAGWVPADKIYYNTTPGTPIAAVSSNDYIYDSSNKPHTTWLQVLSLSGTGIVSDTGNGTTDNWQYHDRQVTPMSNATGTARAFKSIAITSQGLAFAVVSSSGQNDTIESWAMSNDLTTWTAVGNVDVGSSWS